MIIVIKMIKTKISVHNKFIIPYLEFVGGKAKVVLI